MAKQDTIESGASRATVDSLSDHRPQVAKSPQAEVASQTAAPQPAPTKAKSPFPRLFLFVAAVAAVGYGGMQAWDYWLNGRFLVSTDDAYVSADITTIAANTSAYVKAVKVSANTPVKAGDVLIELDKGDATLALQAIDAKIASQKATIARIGQQVKSGETSVEGAEAQLVAVETDLRQAQIDLDRQASLVASAVAAQATLDSATSVRNKDQALVNSAKANLNIAKANVMVVQAQQAEAEAVLNELMTSHNSAIRTLSFTTITAPFDGWIGNMAVEVGDYVTAAQRLASLVPLSKVRIDANFKETQVGDLKPGQPVTFTLDTFPNRHFTGTVTGLAPATGSVFSLLPPQNATGNFTKVIQRLPVRIAIPQEVTAEGIIRPGMSAIVTIDPR